MARIISVCNAKGVGKTTTAINLALFSCLWKVCFVSDMDAQANATVGLGIHIAENGSNVYHSLISDLNPSLVIKNIFVRI